MLRTHSRSRHLISDSSMAQRSLFIFLLVSCFLSSIPAQQANHLPANQNPPHSDQENSVNGDQVGRGDQPVGGQGQNGGNGALSPGAIDDSDIINLADHPACKSDVHRLCEGFQMKKDGDATKQAKNSLDVLECFLNHDDKAVSSECHQVVWDFKKNITKDKRIADIAGSQCTDDLNGDLKVCKQWQADPGHFISCVVEEKTKIKNEQCLLFVNKVALVVFSDYRLVANFALACEADIKRLVCGYVDSKSQAGHSQGAAIACLVRTLEKEHQIKMRAEQGNDLEAKKYIAENQLVDPKCSHQVLRLMELQADDYHLDRPLFFACREDRERLCKDIQSGQGRVYQCLLKQKFDERMATECKELLNHRESAAQTDYKVDYGLAHMCLAEIQQFQCVPPQGSTQDVGISYVILCLEGVLHQQGQNVVRPQCLTALHHQRQAMMSDFNISPNIVFHCKTDIAEHCSKNVHPSAVIHCLMGVAKDQVVVGTGEQTSMQSKISAPCSRELNNLLLAVDVAGDIKVDRALYEACQNVIEKSCKQAQSSAHVMGCLMEHMHVPEMTEDCEKRLLETHYFITRDIRLDTELYVACKTELVEICNVKDDWSPAKKNQAPETGPLAFSCLYRHAFTLGDVDKTGLTPTCLDRVRATMHQRALAMDIPPEVDVSCIHDLAYFCAEKEYKKGQEFNCLQSHYAKLQKQCQAAVQHFTQASRQDMQLSVTYQNCAPMLEKFCQGKMSKDSTFDDAMECLIPHKDDPGMDTKCLAEINHYQMVNIQEYQLNIRFKESCREDANNFCQATLKSKDVGEMVLCLSSILREDTVKGGSQRLSRACQKQLRHDLLTLSEEAQLDPYIKKACESDIPKLCPAGVSKENLLECLRSKITELTESCHKVLFKVEAAQAVDEFGDFALVTACRRVIEKECPSVNGDELLPCLIRAKKANLVDPKCFKVVTTRQLEESKDIRLNPTLYKACNLDLSKFCSKELTYLLSGEKEAVDTENGLILCLKKHKKRLSTTCANQITDMMKEAALDYRLDPKLADVCAQDVKKCPTQESEQGKGQVIECLKNLMKQHLLQKDCAIQVARLVSEGRADIHIDPFLYSACQVDLKQLCFEVQPGEGRQFQCLTNALADGRKMHTECANKLKERVQLQKFAQEFNPPEDLGELAESIVESPSRNYFLAVLGGAVLAVLVIGICCGRATKRIRKELKNR